MEHQLRAADDNCTYAQCDNNGWLPIIQYRPY